MVSGNHIARIFKMEYLRKEVKDEVYFWHRDKQGSLLQVDAIILSVCNQSCPKYPNNKFAISLQYLKKDVSDEVDFLHADKHKGLLQIDILILMEIVRHSQNSQNSKFSMPLRYLNKKVRDEVDFWLNLKVSCKLISALWPSTFPRK